MVKESLGIDEHNLWFVTLIIENIANSMYEGDQVKAMHEMKKFGFIKYLTKSYRVLHTQSIENIIEEYQNVTKAGV